ncbi:methylated-DNA--[protein]-cysteine S-methyltransferase [soil metagenome]
MPPRIGPASTLGFALFETALGACGIAWSQTRLTGVMLPGADAAATRARMRRQFAGAPEGPPPAHAQRAVDGIVALLQGEPRDLLELPLDMNGLPAFHRRVYEIARRISPGNTLTYGEVAHALGEPGAARAVGQALGQNPFAPVVPCHRVLAAGGRSGGFSATGGAVTKLRMLTIEGARLGGAPGLFDGEADGRLS